MNLPVFLTFIGAGLSGCVDPFLRATLITLLFFAHLSFPVEFPLSGVINLWVVLTFSVVPLPAPLAFIGDGSSSFGSLTFSVVCLLASLKFVGDGLSICINPFL